jgi:hypothetical protein
MSKSTIKQPVQASKPAEKSISKGFQKEFFYDILTEE